MSGDLFTDNEKLQPLSELMRPNTLDEVIGHDDLLESLQMLDIDHFPSLILWGTAGCGKTTIARALVNSIAADTYFEQISAVFTTISQLKEIFSRAQERFFRNKATILFVDEIHRFNKTQQDVFLPYIEEGVITLIGATTENPSFSLRTALLSRCQVFEMKPLEYADLQQIMTKVEQKLETVLPVVSEAKDYIIKSSNGDARILINKMEMLIYASKRYRNKIFELEDVVKIVAKKSIKYDKDGDGHYNLASALQKSIRGSDVDSALYYGALMLEGGEDPLFILRRLQIIACEDIGMADPNAILQANAILNSFQAIGLPQGSILIGYLITYLSTCPKSNSAYLGFKKAQEFIHNNPNGTIPKEFLNSPTNVMKKLGYSKGYKYDHDYPNAFAGQNFMPLEYKNVKFYKAKHLGYEKIIEKRMEFWNKRRF